MNYQTYENPCRPWHHVPHFYKAWFRNQRTKPGHLKSFVLLTLQERALNGYEIIKAIENKCGHAPSPAVLYPTLQLLEDQGYVNSGATENKKVYALTDDGKKWLDENRERIDQLTKGTEQSMWNSLPGIGKRVAALAGTIFSNCSYLDEAKIRQIEDLLDETRKHVGDIVFENKTD